MSTHRSSEARIWAIVLVAAAVLLLVGAWFGLPMLSGAVEALNTGVTLESAALWSFGITVVLLIVFAVAAGDSLIGELQFMLAGFFVFFTIITLLIAWIF